MAAPIIVDDLVDQVRDQIDEVNQENISDSDILQSLNRGQDYAVNILARQYEEPLLAPPTTVQTFSGQAEYDLPEDILEDRIEKLEVNELNLKWEVKRISYRDISLYETNALTSRPYHYVVIGKKFRVVPRPSGRFTFRLWYLREPEKLVASQGRITVVNITDNYVVVDNPGDALTTESDSLNSYVNLVDAQTGLIKASMQIKKISDGRITFKSTPDRSTVQGKTIASAIPDGTGDVSAVEADDFVCLSQGVCVPFLKRPLSNFLIQYAVSEIKRRLGEPTEAEAAVLSKFEEQVERQWVGREQTSRVTKRSKNWHQPFRRYFTS